MAEQPPPKKPCLDVEAARQAIESRNAQIDDLLGSLRVTLAKVEQQLDLDGQRRRAQRKHRRQTLECAQKKAKHAEHLAKLERAERLRIEAQYQQLASSQASQAPTLDSQAAPPTLLDHPSSFPMTPQPSPQHSDVSEMAFKNDTAVSLSSSMQNLPVYDVNYLDHMAARPDSSMSRPSLESQQLHHDLTNHVNRSCLPKCRPIPIFLERTRVLPGLCEQRCSKFDKPSPSLLNDLTPKLLTNKIRVLESPKFVNKLKLPVRAIEDWAFTATQMGCKHRCRIPSILWTSRNDEGNFSEDLGSYDDHFKSLVKFVGQLTGSITLRRFSLYVEQWTQSNPDYVAFIDQEASISIGIQKISPFSVILAHKPCYIEFLHQRVGQLTSILSPQYTKADAPVKAKPGAEVILISDDDEDDEIVVLQPVKVDRGRKKVRVPTGRVFVHTETKEPYENGELVSESEDEGSNRFSWREQGWRMAELKHPNLNPKLAYLQRLWNSHLAPFRCQLPVIPEAFRSLCQSFVSSNWQYIHQARAESEMVILLCSLVEAGMLGEERDAFEVVSKSIRFLQNKTDTQH